MAAMDPHARVLIQHQRTVTIPALESNRVNASHQSNDALSVVCYFRETCKNRLTCPGRDNNFNYEALQLITVDGSELVHA